MLWAGWSGHQGGEMDAGASLQAVFYLFYCVHKMDTVVLSSVGAGFSTPDQPGMSPLSPGMLWWINRLPAMPQRLTAGEDSGFYAFGVPGSVYLPDTIVKTLFQGEGDAQPHVPGAAPWVCVCRTGPRYFYKRGKRKQTKSTDGTPQMEGDIMVIYLKSC